MSDAPAGGRPRATSPYCCVMAKMRRADSKTALAQQRAGVQRGARGKSHIGDDTGGERARAAQRERVHRMQEDFKEQRATEQRNQFLVELRQQREQAEARADEARAGRLQEPLTALFAELVTDGFRLARTFVLLPFRVVAVLRGHGPAVAEA